MDLERIVAHGDFDGVVSSALCSFVHGIDRFLFTTPSSVERSEISITAKDIVCDLPYPLECGLWFDHHAGNRQALELRKIDPSSIPGRLDENAPSCARVIFDFYSGDVDFPSSLAEAVLEADAIDSFSYSSIDEWRRETPGKIVDKSIKAPSTDRREQYAYLTKLARLLRDGSLEDVAREGSVLERAGIYSKEESRMIDFISQSISYLSEDRDRELVVLDFTSHTRQPRIQKNLAYLVAPNALGVLVLSPVFRNERKTNDISVVISLSLNASNRQSGRDLGEMMRVLGLGTGHAGAAAGILHNDSKEAMLRAKNKLLSDIWRLWSKGAGK